MTQVMRSSNVLEIVRRLLDEGHPQEALETLSHNRQTTQAAENARAVCLMRLDKPLQAINVLRPILFPHGSVVMDTDAPVIYRTNYVTALLLANNPVPAMDVLSGIHERHDPAVTKLRAAIRKWRSSLNPLERLLFLVGKCPSKAFAPDFPPGDV